MRSYGKPEQALSGLQDHSVENIHVTKTIVSYDMGRDCNLERADDYDNNDQLHGRVSTLLPTCFTLSCHRQQVLGGLTRLARCSRDIWSMFLKNGRFLTDTVGFDDATAVTTYPVPPLRQRRSGRADCCMREQLLLGRVTSRIQ